MRHQRVKRNIDSIHDCPEIPFVLQRISTFFEPAFDRCERKSLDIRHQHFEVAAKDVYARCYLFEICAFCLCVFRPFAHGVFDRDIAIGDHLDIRCDFCDFLIQVSCDMCFFGNVLDYFHMTDPLSVCIDHISGIDLELFTILGEFGNEFTFSQTIDATLLSTADIGIPVTAFLADQVRAFFTENSFHRVVHESPFRVHIRDGKREGNGIEDRLKPRLLILKNVHEAVDCLHSDSFSPVIFFRIRPHIETAFARRFQNP